MNGTRTARSLWSQREVLYKSSIVFIIIILPLFLNLLCPGVLVVLWWSDGQVGVVVVHGSFEAVARA